MTNSKPLTGHAYHLIGIGGAGMSVVALLLAEHGATVTGSDASSGPAFENLAAQGLRVVVGHDAANVPEGATVVVSTAIKDSNPELQVARERGQEIIHRSQALALAADGRDFVAVAGAHGKTTTSGMLAEALTAAGQEPSFAIGGVVQALGTGAHIGLGPAFVAEADESDRSFLNYTPAISIVLNVEADHLDTYGSEEAFARIFEDFADRLRPGGLLLACSDDAGAARLAAVMSGRGTRVWTFGQGSVADLPGGTLIGEAHIQVRITEQGAAGSVSTLSLFDAAGKRASATLRLAMPGTHVAVDAAAAWGAGLELGVNPQLMADSLGVFGGTKRRFERRGEAAGVLVIDDYAHHPTELEALLPTARALVDSRNGRLLALFQPHLFSRTVNFAARFAAALDQADLGLVTGIYPARERQEDFPQVTGAIIAEKMSTEVGLSDSALDSADVAGLRSHYIADRWEAARALAAQAQPGDVLLTIGAGDVTELAPLILETLEERGAALAQAAAAGTAAVDSAAQEPAAMAEQPSAESAAGSSEERA